MENIDCFIRITFMHFDTSTVIWHKNFIYKFAKMLQLLGDFVLQTPTGASPLDPTGGLPSPKTPGRRPPL